MNVLGCYSIINSNCKEYYECLPVISILSTSYKTLNTLVVFKACLRFITTFSFICVSHIVWHIVIISDETRVLLLVLNKNMNIPISKNDICQHCYTNILIYFIVISDI